MSILNVKNMTQGFGDKIIFNNVNFKLEKNEHIGQMVRAKLLFLNLLQMSYFPTVAQFIGIIKLVLDIWIKMLI